MKVNKRTKISENKYFLVVNNWLLLFQIPNSIYLLRSRRIFQFCKNKKLVMVLSIIVCEYLCLVLLQVAKYFVPVQIFWVSPKIWLHLVPHKKLFCRHKNQFYWMQIIFLSGTKCVWLAQNVNKFLVRHKKFGSAQNILGPVKGQGISCIW